MGVQEHRSAVPRRARRAAPTLLAAALALAYVLTAPRSPDLAAQLLRAKLFGAEGFGLWNNWWYAGHYAVGYSVLFPPLAELLTPQLIAAAAATASAAIFEALTHEHFGPRSAPAAIWFAAATAAPLLSGRLTFSLGLATALAAALALKRGHPLAATGAAVLTALASPVAALFAALAGTAYALTSRRKRPGIAVAAAALGPVLVLAIAFPEGGTEPFALSAFWPIPVIAVALLALAPRTERTVRAGTVLYALGCLAAFVLPTPVGGNAARLGTLIAGPLAALLATPNRLRYLLAAAVPLAYLQWQGAIRDVIAAQADPSTQSVYYRPLLRFLAEQRGPPFRVEIPFTAEHWEAYEVAPRFPLARGWERQLDRLDNPIFYTRGALTPPSYEAWLHRLGVRFVALPDVALDPASNAAAEASLVSSGEPFLKLVHATRDWRVYAVADPTPIVTGTATLIRLGPNSLTLAARRGDALVRVRYSPYWRLSGVPGCVLRSGRFTALSLRHRGRATLTIEFAPGRIDAADPRCEHQ